MSNRKKEYKDKEKWRKTNYKQKKKYYSKTSYAANRYNRWTDEEISLILDHKMTDTELSKKLGRSVASIQAKRALVRNALLKKMCVALRRKIK